METSRRLNECDSCNNTLSWEEKYHNHVCEDCLNIIIQAVAHEVNQDNMQQVRRRR